MFFWMVSSLSVVGVLAIVWGLYLLLASLALAASLRANAATGRAARAAGRRRGDAHIVRYYELESRCEAGGGLSCLT
jgi:hypothetical protein